MANKFKLGGTIPFLILIVITLCSCFKHHPDGDSQSQEWEDSYCDHYPGNCSSRLAGPSNPDEVHFYLFRDPQNVNSSEELFLDDADSIRNSKFDYTGRHRRTIFVTHGFNNDGNSSFGYFIRRELFLSGNLPNIIIVDWGKYAIGPVPAPGLLTYSVIALRNVPMVAKRIADFINFLLANSFTRLRNIHLIGHSLGAQASGRAAGQVSNQNEGRKINRISGLDPAGPYFQGPLKQRRLTKEDADFVDIYHSNGGSELTLHAGTNFWDQGHVDFLLNGGSSQPGCSFFSNVLSCSHSFAYIVYAATINKDFQGCRCGAETSDPCPDYDCEGENGVLAGYRIPHTARGRYYLKTSANPFSETEEMTADWMVNPSLEMEALCSNVNPLPPPAIPYDPQPEPRPEGAEDPVEPPPYPIKPEPNPPLEPLPQPDPAEGEQDPKPDHPEKDQDPKPDPPPEGQSDVVDELLAAPEPEEELPVEANPEVPAAPELPPVEGGPVDPNKPVAPAPEPEIPEVGGIEEPAPEPAPEPPQPEPEPELPVDAGLPVGPPLPPVPDPGETVEEELPDEGPGEERAPAKHK